MSYEAEINRDKNIQTYETLKNRRSAIENHVQTWVSDATAFHAETAASDEKAEILAIRTTLISNLRTILGL